MKKLSLLLGTTLLLSVSTILNSCRKDSTDLQGKNLDISERVYAWLDKQKSVSQPNKASNIDLLKRSLDFSNLEYESFNGDDQLIIIPIKGDFNINKGADKNSILNLVLIDDKLDFIKNGRIALFTSTEVAKRNKIPSNTFTKVLNIKPAACNGSFQFLSVTGQMMHKFEYENGKIKSFAEIRQDTINNIQNGASSTANANCIDWYIVTTYYVDGIPVSQDYQYIGTTCGVCDNPDLASICPDNGDGGGGGGVNDEIITSNESFTTFEEDETNSFAGGGAPLISYQHNAHVTRTNGQVTSVIVDPTTIDNNNEVYVDSYGRSTNRILTVSGHNNSWTSLGPRVVVYWSCYVYGRYIYTNGNPEYNRQWLHAKTATR